jgi:hypothetical protein
MDDINYTWTIVQLVVDNADASFPRKVTGIHWRLKGEKNNVFGEAVGFQSIGNPSSEVFTNFEDLTEAQVIDWLETKLNEATKQRHDGEIIDMPTQLQNFKNSIAVQISEKSETVVENLAAPWS